MDVLDFAMDMNRKGRDFYRLLARRAAHPGAQKVFDRMAEEEERLLEGYRRMRMLNAGQGAESTLLEKNGGPFPAPAGLPPLLDEVSASRVVVELERKVCRLLEGAAGKETDASARELLQAVAAVECGEMRQLEDLYDFINAPNEYLAWGEFSNLGEFHNFGRYEDNRICGHTARDH